jgi:hypothetical protein
MQDIENYSTFADECPGCETHSFAYGSEKEDRIKFLKKMNEAKKEILACDWTADKMNTAFGYKYVSDGKIMRNIMPILVNKGIDFAISYSCAQELKPLDKMQHWTVVASAYFTDCDTGYRGDVLTAPGEGSDSAAGSLYKAKTFAKKTILVSYFGITDNIDLDSPINDRVSNPFKPKSEEETAVIKSKIDSMTVPVPPKADAKPKTPVKLNGNMPSKAKEVKAEPEPVKEVKVAETPSETPSADSEDNFNPHCEIGKDYFTKYAINPVQVKAGQKVLDKWETAYKDGKISKERLIRLHDELRMVESLSGFVEFISLNSKVSEE